MGGVTFRGFFVRARLAADDSFLTNAPFTMIAGQTNTRISSCTPANVSFVKYPYILLVVASSSLFCTQSGITHTNAQLPRVELTEVQFQWTAPPEGTGTIFFG